MTIPLPIATALADALRVMPCTRVASYAGVKPDPPCRHCAALADYDAYVSIVAVPGQKP